MTGFLDEVQVGLVSMYLFRDELGYEGAFGFLFWATIIAAVFRWPRCDDS